MTLPNYLMEAFENIPTDRTVNVLIRHSARFPIESDAEVFTAQLTPEGEILATKLGAWINKKFCIGNIVSSPINRCLETGRHLANGAGNGKIILPEPVLGHPNEYGEYDALGDYLVSGDWPLRIRQIADILFPDDQKAHLNFFITHDTVLALMAAYWLDLDIRDGRVWPQFLEPMFFYKVDGESIINFRSKEFIVA